VVCQLIKNDVSGQVSGVCSSGDGWRWLLVPLMDGIILIADGLTIFSPLEIFINDQPSGILAWDDAMTWVCCNGGR